MARRIGGSQSGPPIFLLGSYKEFNCHCENGFASDEMAPSIDFIAVTASVPKADICLQMQAPFEESPPSLRSEDASDSNSAIAAAPTPDR